MNKQFLKSSLSIAMSVFMIATTISIAFAAKSEGAEQNENYVPISEIKDAAASSFQPGYDPWKAFDGVENNAGNCCTPLGERT